MATTASVKNQLTKKTAAEMQAPAPMSEEQEMLQLVRDKHKSLSDVEIRHLYHLAKSYGLDPNKNEIWAMKYGNGPATIFVGRDGLLGIAHKTGQLDGIETLAIVQDKNGNVQETKIVYPGAKLIGATCTVWRKDMSHPVNVAVSLSEYDGKRGNWAKMPETMIKKVAEAHALRRAFSIHGLYLQEEFDGNHQDISEPKHKVVRDQVPDHVAPSSSDSDSNTEQVEAEVVEPTLESLSPKDLENVMKPLMLIANKLAALWSMSPAEVIEVEVPDLMNLTIDGAREAWRHLNSKLKEQQQQ